jgi:hypothetical protein
MSPRRVLLLVMLLALAGCAALGMFALVAWSGEIIWKLVWTALSTAVATGMLLPLSLLVERPRVKAGGLCGMLTVIVCWLMLMVMIWGGGIVGWNDDLFWRAFILFWSTLLVGVPLMGALLVVSFPWARVAVWTFAAISAGAYALYILALLLPRENSWGMSAFSWKFWVTGWCVQSIGAVASMLLVNIGCGDRRYFRWAGVVCCAVSLAIGIAGVWLEHSDSPLMGRIMALALIAAVAMAHINLLLMARLKPSQRWLKWGTMAFVLVAGASAFIAVLLFSDLNNIEDVMLMRLAAASTIAGGCGSLALIVLSLFNRNPEHAPRVATEFKEMTIFCPSCSTKQSVPLGDSTCRVCSLQISIKVMEPRCAGCGYLLYRIESDRCPECGSPIRKAEGAAAEVAVASSGAATAGASAGVESA